LNASVGTTLADTEDLLRRAQDAGIRHLVGLQRRMGPSARYVRDLLAQGYLGQIHSVRMHVSMNYFQGRRSTDLAWTIPPENCSQILSIYGGHFMAYQAPDFSDAVCLHKFIDLISEASAIGTKQTA